MKIGLVGFPGSGKSTVFGALTGLAVETGFGARKDKANLGAVKVPDARVDALAKLYSPKKKTYAEITFTDLAAGTGEGLDRSVLNSMRNLDALCHVVRAFPDAAGEPAEPLREIVDLETETILADLELVEQRVARLQKDRSNPRELELLQRLQSALESERALRRVPLADEERRMLAGYSFLTQKPLLLVLNVGEADAGARVRTAVLDAIAAGRSTADIGGRLSTTEFTAEVVRRAGLEPART